MAHAFFTKNTDRVSKSPRLLNDDPAEVRRLMWDPPHPQSPAEARDHRVSWAELFFDLVFVAILSQLALSAEHDFSHDTGAALEDAPFSLTASGSAVLSTVTLGTLTLQAWFHHTIFTTRFAGNQDIVGRVLMFALMLALIFVAANTGNISDMADMSRLSVSFAMVCLVEAIMHVRVLRFAPQTRASNLPVALYLGGSTVFYLLLSLTDSPDAFVVLVWAAQLVALAVVRLQKRAMTSFAQPTEHYPERLGLLVVVALGELVVVVCTTIAEQAGTWASFWGRSLGFGIIFSLWWLYYLRTPGAELVGSYSAALLYTCVHIPLVVGSVLLAAALTVTLESWAEHPEEDLPAPVSIVACLSLAACSVSQKVITALMRHEEEERSGRPHASPAAISFALSTPVVIALGAVFTWRPSGLVLFLSLASLYRLVATLHSYVVKHRALALAPSLVDGAAKAAAAVSGAAVADAQVSSDVGEALEAARAGLSSGSGGAGQQEEALRRVVELLESAQRV